MTFRELAGHYKSLERRRLEDWDRSVWMTMQLLAPHVKENSLPSFYDFHPLRDAVKETRKDQFESDDEIREFMNSLTAKHG